jgi:GrpB-like predicted nucleotidyltransferase (UPF0157 family)
VVNQDSVVIVRYDPEWTQLFEQERAALATTLADLEVSIAHIGSTAVPGLAAKSIIDILIEAPALPSPTPPSWAGEGPSPSVVFARALAVIHYIPDYDDGGKSFYFKRQPRFNLWVYLTGDNRAQDLVLFRDYLRSHPTRAQEYEELKVSLGLKHSQDIAMYTQGKIAFVRQTLELARETGTAR